ncbi:MAG: hypothetical protein Hens2KO_11200 [Henriciella sp.]
MAFVVGARAPLSIVMCPSMRAIGMYISCVRIIAFAPLIMGEDVFVVMLRMGVMMLNRAM